MQKFDVLIVGGGMVGLTLALAIREQSQLTVAIADTKAVEEKTEQPQVRVSAINAASANIFANLSVWDDILQQRAQPYRHMHIWDKGGYGQLNFAQDDLKGSDQQEQLGWIIENNIIRHALWHKAQADEGISFFTEQAITSIGVGDSEVFASLGSATPIIAKLLVGADGANSWVRQQMNMSLTFRDYDHHALVATVSCEQGHQDTAWQVFLPEGPLAFLPLYQDNLCSIVWSTSPEEAKRLTELEPEDFAKEITAASDGKLGRVSLESERFTFPLSMRLAQNFVKQRVVLIGDAAHTIHPLAGQGVNLGLLDAAALAQTLISQEKIDNQLKVNQVALQQFARWRKAEAAEMMAAMEAIKQVFTPQQEAMKLFRGLGLSLLEHFAPAKKQLIRQALGYKGNLPELAKSKR